MPSAPRAARVPGAPRRPAPSTARAPRRASRAATQRLFGGLELDPAILGVGLGPHQLASQRTNPIPMPDHVGDRSPRRRAPRRAPNRVEAACASASLRGAVRITRASATRAARVFSRRADRARAAAEAEAAMSRLVSAAARSVTAPTAVADRLRRRTRGSTRRPRASRDSAELPGSARSAGDRRRPAGLHSASSEARASSSRHEVVGGLTEEASIASRLRERLVDARVAAGDVGADADQILAVAQRRQPVAHLPGLAPVVDGRSRRASSG